MPTAQPARRYRFGIFELDATTGELRRQGALVRLHAQPFQVLLLLLERPGEVLTREDLSRQLWPEGTFVDYEHGVNSAINRLREALGDKASSPRFVETLARRGYRFVAPVERMGFETEAPVSPLAAQPEFKRGRFNGFLSSPEDLPRSSPAVVRTLFVLLQIMYLGFYTGALANLAELNELFSTLSFASTAYTVMIVTAAVLIPARIFLLSAVLFHAPGFREKYLRLWWFLLPLDALWSLAPFLLLHHMSSGLAMACVAPLVYSPFAQRSLVLMGPGEERVAAKA